MTSRGVRIGVEKALALRRLENSSATRPKSPGITQVRKSVSSRGKKNEINEPPRAGGNGETSVSETMFLPHSQLKEETPPSLTIKKRSNVTGLNIT